jgi:hypothetical protein
VFISYATEDAAAAARVAERLTSKGLTVWLDRRNLQGGSQIDSKIEGAIERSRLFVPLLSRTTEARRENAYFRMEWDRASQRARKNAPDVTYIYPIIIDDSPLEAMNTVSDWRARLLFRRAPAGNLDDGLVLEIQTLCADRKRR